MFKQKEPVSHYINCEGYEIHVTEWGVDNPKSILMWHGLARTGRDFDTIAQALSSQYRVLCPDTLGRGLSSWSRNPIDEYCFDFYEKIAAKICDTFGFFMFDYIGTSMGGALGIRLAAGSMKDRINHLIINDIAPELAKPAVERILSYAGTPAVFNTIMELEDYLRTIYEPYGYITNDQWRTMSESSYRRLENGQITLHYDPKMVQQFISHPDDYTQWETYEAITQPTLVLRGENSDLLLPEWAERMMNTGPKAHLVQIPKCGHAPALNNTQQIKIVKDFLEG
jgi:pimeloyl-ACP methyl ester carboxylesterase